MDRFLEGKVAVVTGGSQGIGRACALALAARGASVVVASRKLAACEAVVAEVEAAGGLGLALACHIGKPADCETLIAETLRRFGRIDVLVLNAAINAAFAPIEELQDAAIEKTVGANLLGNLSLCRLAYPALKASGSGSIVLVTSVGGRLASAGVALYGVTKAACEQLVRSLAIEWGPVGIRANAVAPGLIRTHLASAFLENEGLVRGVERQNPLRRIGEPQDVAGVVDFLVSPGAAYVNGQTIVVDGGASVSAVSAAEPPL